MKKDNNFLATPKGTTVKPRVKWISRAINIIQKPFKECHDYIGGYVNSYKTEGIKGLLFHWLHDADSWKINT